MSSSSSANSLRPAWHRGSQSGAKGFQPPPTVATSERGRSASIGAAPSEAHRRDSNFNAFAALDDDDDNNAAAAAGDAPPPEETTTTTTKQQAPPPPRENSRSEALRTAKTTRSMSAGGKSSGGRSLADLAARVPPERNHSRFSSLSMRYSGGGGGDSSSAADYDAAAGKYEQQQQAKVIRYTREKLLSMRPTPKSALPDALKEFEGAVILSESAQDPVCWDTFDAEAIWASVPRRASTKAADGTEGGVRRMSSRRDSGGRWQRGVALPPPDQAGKKGREKDASNPNELWDDPAQTAAASDFSAFGGIPDDEETFDLDKMAEATRKFEEELHGSRSRASSNADSEEFGNTHSVKVDPKRPLASVGTTIRAGSGDNVNVFEDFDEPGPEEEKKETPAIKAGDEDPSASSRLMAMIGVKKEAPPETAAAPERETPESEAKAASPWGDTSAQPKAADGMAIPLNPWGTGIATSAPQSSVAPHGLDIQAQLHEAAELERKKREEEEMRRRKEQEEAQRRLSQQKAEELARQAAIQQQQQQHQQHQQQQAGVQSQVELVLLERISTILENSWGRADLMTILSTLHAEDARVIPLLNNVDALRALIMRNPRRITLRHDPSVGVEVAVLVATNAQWQQQQQQQQLQQQQQEAQARAQEEQLRLRQEQQRRLEEQQKAAAAKAAAAAAPPPVSPDAPWYYSDPQNNIQGPFRGNEMRQWLEAGYFKGDLPISQQPNGPFSPLSVIFPDLSVAFQVPSDPAADAARAKAEAEEKERQEAAERARAKAEAEAKAREAAERERERQAQQEAAERERRKAAQEAENAKKAASGKKANGGNESSAQLKMMLGLPSQGDGIPSTPNEKQPEESAAKGAERRPSKASGKNAAASKVSHPSADTASTSNKAPSSAWGGAAKPATRKSMSEIQKEEARAAAIAAMQREGSRSSSSGWANVAASRGGSTAWSGGAVKHAPPAVLTSSSNAAPASTAARPRQQSLGGSKPRTGGAPQQRSRSTSNAAEEFGAKMSPALESWCKDQMLKLNGTDDLTLVSFCMTLNDASEIRQYLTAYLGSTPQVNNFATEFINKKGLGKGAQEEWETTGTAKKSRKKKTSSR